MLRYSCPSNLPAEIGKASKVSGESDTAPLFVVFSIKTIIIVSVKILSIFGKACSPNSDHGAAKLRFPATLQFVSTCLLHFGPFHRLLGDASG